MSMSALGAKRMHAYQCWGWASCADARLLYQGFTVTFYMLQSAANVSSTSSALVCCLLARNSKHAAPEFH